MATVTVKCGDPNIAGAIVEGASAAQLRTIQEECNHLKAVNGVRSEGDLKRWERTRRRLARKYTIQPVGPVKGAILGAWGLAWLVIAGAWRYLDQWNREGHRGHFQI